MEQIQTKPQNEEMIKKYIYNYTIFPIFGTQFLNGGTLLHIVYFSKNSEIIMYTFFSIT